MHYAILKFDKELLKYEIVHWTHSLADLERMQLRWPEAEGYLHMIELKYITKHEVVAFIKGIKV